MKAERYDVSRRRAAAAPRGASEAGLGPQRAGLREAQTTRATLDTPKFYLKFGDFLTLPSHSAYCAA